MGLAAATATPNGNRSRGRAGRTAGLVGKGGKFAGEDPAFALGIFDGRIGLGDGADQFDGGAVLLAEVLVQGHGCCFRLDEVGSGLNLEDFRYTAG